MMGELVLNYLCHPGVKSFFFLYFNVNNNVPRGETLVYFNGLIKTSSVMSLICLYICPQMVANMASGLLAEPGPSGGTGVSDKT